VGNAVCYLLCISVYRLTARLQADGEWQNFRHDVIKSFGVVMSFLSRFDSLLCDVIFYLEVTWYHLLWFFILRVSMPYCLRALRQAGLCICIHIRVFLQEACISTGSLVCGLTNLHKQAGIRIFSQDGSVKCKTRVIVVVYNCCCQLSTTRPLCSRSSLSPPFFK
jgi:hypothetical protein